MKNEALKYGTIGLLAGAALVWFGATTAVNSNNASMMQMIGMRSTVSQNIMRNSNTIDAHFIEQMIPHHEDAITIAKIALTKGEHDEVKTLAQSIIDSQGREIEEMKSWYKEWFGRELPTGSQVMMHHGMMSNTGMHMGMTGNDTDIASLENSENFDKEFIEGMIPHHQMAVMMASMLKNGTSRPEMKKLADDIIAAQTQEIDQMRQWYNTWGY